MGRKLIILLAGIAGAMVVGFLRTGLSPQQDGTLRAIVIAGFILLCTAALIIRTVSAFIKGYRGED